MGKCFSQHEWLGFDDEKSEGDTGHALVAAIPAIQRHLGRKEQVGLHLELQRAYLLVVRCDTATQSQDLHAERTCERRVHVVPT